MSEATRSCDSCPAFVAPRDDKNPIQGVGYCAQKQVPLHTGRHDAAQRDQIKVDLAEACDWYGFQPTEPSPGTPVVIRVGAHKKDADDRAPGEVAPRSCTGCEHLVPTSETISSFGLPASLCMAHGILIPHKLGRRYAQGCAKGKVQVAAVPSLVLNEFELFPYLKVVDTTNQPARVRVKKETHPNDADLFDGKDPKTGELIPVSDEHRALGIRAWRRVYHPFKDNKEAPCLPVFSRDFFPSEEQAKIPVAGGKYHPELYRDHANLVHRVAVDWVNEQVPALIGAGGTGKTELFAHAAWLMGLPFDRISITATSDPFDILGKHLVEVDPESGQTVTNWHHGRLSSRWTKPGVLLVDEPNAGPDEIWHTLRPTTDNASQLVLDQDKGQALDRNPMCFFGMAMNPPWDPMYVGVREISEADGQRLSFHDVPIPPEAIEREIIVTKCQEVSGFEISNKQLNVVMSFANEIRQMAANGSVQVSWGVRTSLKVAGRMRYLSFYEAVGAALLNRVDPTTREGIMTILRSHEDV